MELQVSFCNQYSDTFPFEGYEDNFAPKSLIFVAMKPVLVVKFGTASLTDEAGHVIESRIGRIASQVASLKEEYRFILVTSGAVGAGKSALKNYRGELKQKKAAAAIGNPILMNLYAQAFGKFGLSVAQCLIERQHFAGRSHFLQLKDTFETLWENEIIPIANENDVVANVELRFSDNDELATLLAAGFGAKTLIFSTSSGGLRDLSGQIIPQVRQINSEIWNLVDNQKSSLGTGGMLSKLSFTRRAVQLGIRVIICSVAENEGMLNALKGISGTVFPAQKVNRNLRQRWLSTGSLVAGYLTVDLGAAKAILARKSLLAVGLLHMDGEFEAGEVVEILSEDQSPLAIGRVKVSGRYLSQHWKEKKLEVVHADDLVIL